MRKRGAGWVSLFMTACSLYNRKCMLGKGKVTCFLTCLLTCSLLFDPDRPDCPPDNPARSSEPRPLLFSPVTCAKKDSTAKGRTAGDAAAGLRHPRAVGAPGPGLVPSVAVPPADHPALLRSDPPLPALRLAPHPALLPLHPQLQPVRRPGPAQVRPGTGAADGALAYPALQSLGRLGPRPSVNRHPAAPLITWGRFRLDIQSGDSLIYAL